MKHKKTVSEKEVSCTLVKKLLIPMEDSSPQLHGKQVSLAGRKDKVEILLISDSNCGHLDAEAEIVEAHKEEHGITKGKFGWQTPFAVKN